MIDGLVRINDTLAKTPVHNKYWLCGGAVLGWAREGALLKHDPDIDFHIWKDDVPALLQSIPALKSAGFEPVQKWVNPAGEITIYVFSYRKAKFEFFVSTEVNGNMQCNIYHGHEPTYQTTCETPGCELDEFEFYGRTWLKPKNHEQYLTALYGDWKKPNKNFKHETESPSVIASVALPGLQPWQA